MLGQLVNRDISVVWQLAKWAIYMLGQPVNRNIFMCFGSWPIGMFNLYGAAGQPKYLRGWAAWQPGYLHHWAAGQDGYFCA